MNRKLKGSSLLETIIAMVITLISFGIVTTIIVKVVSFNKSGLRVKNEIMLSGLADKIKSERDFLDATFKSDGVLIEQTISRYEGAEDLFLLKLTSKDPNGKIVASHAELIREK